MAPRYTIYTQYQYRYTTQLRFFFALPLHRRTILSHSHVCSSAIICSLLILIYTFFQIISLVQGTLQSGAEEGTMMKPSAHPTTYWLTVTPSLQTLDSYFFHFSTISQVNLPGPYVLLLNSQPSPCHYYFKFNLIFYKLWLSSFN